MLFLGCVQSQFYSVISEGRLLDLNGPERHRGSFFFLTEEWLQWCQKTHRKILQINSQMYLLVVNVALQPRVPYKVLLFTVKFQ